MDQDLCKQLLNAVAANNVAIKETSVAIKESSATQLEKIEELRNDITTEVAAVKEEVAKVSSTVAKHESAIENLRRQMNELEQSKLESHMEIVGIEKAELDAHREDAAALAIKVIRRFMNDFDPAWIHRAFIRNIRVKDFSNVVVVFNSAAHKQAVIKRKREVKNDAKIFFDDHLTATTRALFMKARQKAKDTGAKRATVNHGRVSITLQDDSRVNIRWFNDLEGTLTPQPSPAH